MVVVVVVVVVVLLAVVLVGGVGLGVIGTRACLWESSHSGKSEAE